MALVVKCIDCGKEVNIDDADLIKFGLKELFELNDELGLKNSLEGLDEIGDFYQCKECEKKLGKMIRKVFEDLDRGFINGKKTT